MIRNGRRTLAALLALIMVLVLLPTVSAQADGEIEIANYEQLKAFAARVNGGEKTLNAKLTEDITCTDKTWTPIGTDNESYEGTFNGQGHTITGLSNADVDYSGLSADDEVYIGLFGVVESGKVQNVVIEDCELSFASDVDVCVFMGAVVGRNESGTVEDCSVSGTVSGSKNGPNRLYVGGGVGQNRHFVRNCRNTGAVSASGKDYSVYVGGVVGGSDGSEQYCVNTGAINGGGNAMAGGVTGLGESVKNCLNAGAVNGYALGGGIVGYTAYGTVENCLNVGAVSDGSYSGGIVGQNAYGAVKTCLSVGAVSGTEFVGGVVGHCPYSASPNFCVENCYCLYTETSDAIGNEGAATVTNVYELSAEQLKSLSNCVGFSTDTWYEGLYYPVLKALSGEVHLYANSNEDLVLQRFICAYAPTKIANPFTYEGHEFTGWNTQADGDGVPYSEDDEITLLPGETFSLSAQWKKTNAFMIMFQNEDGTELQSGPVAVGETPVYEGETPTKAPTVEHLYTFAGWKLLGTETVLTELPVVDGEATYVAAYTESDRVYTGPVWAWDGYESATATFTATDDTTFTQVLTAEGDAITHMTTVEPDCEYPGVETYTAKVTFLSKDYFNDKTKEIAKRDHIWVFDEFVWTPNEQGIYTVVANFHCERYASHTLEFIPVAGMATDPETCTEDGCVHYVAFIGAEESPDGLEHNDNLDIVIPAHGHQWSAPDYERIETETGYDVYAIVRCYYDYSHRIEETVHATYEVITPPTLEEEGLGRYTADFEDEHLWDIQWEVVIPKLALGLYGEDVNAFDVAEYTDDGTLYRYDVKFRNDAGTLPIVSMQAFIGYDAEALTLVEAKTDLPGSVTTRDENGVFSFAWANDEGIEMASGAVVVSLYFKLDGTVQDGDVLVFPFTDGDFHNSAAYLDNGVVTEAAAFETKDGSISFAVPELTIAGEDVLSGDIYVIEDGKILYRYDVRVKDLPETGLMINSAQIFLGFDHEILAVAKTEGIIDWMISESGDKLMASWASDTDVQIKEDDIVLTLWFTKIGEAPEDGVVPIVFTVNPLGFESAFSTLLAGAVKEVAANTVDGSITFETMILGDANCDGEVTAADAALILRTLVGLSELSPRGVLNADVDGDGEVTAEDAAIILRMIVGLIDTFPAEEP